MRLRRAFLRFAPWGLAGCFTVIAALITVSLVAGYPRVAMAMLVMALVLVAVGVVFIGAPWLLLWPRQTRPPLAKYLRALGQGDPLTPPRATPRE
jgi:hypothetical protein